MSSPSQRRADSCWSDAVSVKTHISLPPWSKVSQLKPRQSISEVHNGSGRKNSWARGACSICRCCFTVGTCCHSSLIFSYLACFQAITLKCPRGEQTGSSHTSPGMNRAVSMTTTDLVTPTALVRKYDFFMVTLFCIRLHLNPWQQAVEVLTAACAQSLLNLKWPWWCDYRSARLIKGPLILFWSVIHKTVVQRSSHSCFLLLPHIVNRIWRQRVPT